MKDDLRRRLRASRRSLPPAVRASETRLVAEALIAELTRNRPAALAAYLAMPGELDLASVITWWWSTGAAVWLPRVRAPGELDWHPVHCLAQVATASYGIAEPDPAQVPAAPLPAGVAVLVPGVAFDRRLRRLGQGGGFYDRVAVSGERIGVGLGCQLVEEVPCEAHDRPVDRLLIAGAWIPPVPA